MIVKLTRKGDNGCLKAIREPKDPKFYSDSTLLHHVKLELIKQGHDVIKKRMWRDGHLVADEQQYIRTRSRKVDGDSFHAWDANYAVRMLYEKWNKNGEIELWVQYNIFSKSGKEGVKA